ncbi:MAG: glycosyltransferase family 4 protein [Candidatus Methanomethylicia archaeon]
MRILHVAYIYPPELKVADGITNVVYNVTKQLAKRGHKVEVYTSNLSNLHSRELMPSGLHIINGVDVFYFRSLLKYKTFTLTPSIIPTIIRNAKNFDVIHVHDARSFQGVSAYLTNKIKNIPYVFQPHGSYLTYLPEPFNVKILKNTLDKLISNRIFKNASKIIALNRFEAEQYRAVGVSEEKIAIIPNGIDLAEYANLPAKGLFKRKFGISEEKKIILYLGRIHRTKGINLLIKAYAYLVKKTGYKDAILVIAGPDDGYLNEAKTLAKSLNIHDSVIFTGFISKEDKLKALVDAEVFVTPSFYGFPMTFLEACVTGTPIVTTNLGDILEWINNKVGYVAKPIPYDIAKAIHNIISDEELYRKFSENCINIVKSYFSIENVVSMLEKVYENVLEGGA